MLNIVLQFNVELVIKSLKIAKSYTNIPTEDLVLIKNACKSIYCTTGGTFGEKGEVKKRLYF